MFYCKKDRKTNLILEAYIMMEAHELIITDKVSIIKVKYVNGLCFFLVKKTIGISPNWSTTLILPKKEAKKQQTRVKARLNPGLNHGIKSWIRYR